MGDIKLVACIVVIALVAGPGGEAAITCGQVLTGVYGCAGYLQRGGAVSPSCCDGLKSIVSSVRNTADVRALCGCLKSLVPATGTKPEFLNSLPAKCSVRFPYTYSPSMDCSKLIYA